MEPIHYLALGDSYTIGTGLEDQSANFPSLLARQLTEEIGVPVDVRNLGVNGYTTADLIREELPAARTSKPELVTVLIGANDVVQGVGEALYRDRLAEIYDAIRKLGVPLARVLAISIPDFSALPGAASFGAPELLHARIIAFNQLARSEAETRGFGFIDITSLSTESHGRADWLAADNLHPGPAQHRAFAERIWEVARPQWVAPRFDRWSPAAKTVLEVAQREAVTRQHAYIGTEHLLLGLYTDQITDEILNRDGLSYRKADRVINDVLGRKGGRPRPSRIIPTSRTKRVLRIATVEAATGRAPFVEPQHILRALILEGEGIAAHLLQDAGVTIAEADVAVAGSRDSRLSQAWSRIELLPSEQRTVMRLILDEDRKIEEIAAIMGKSSGAVKLLLHRAVEQLRNDPHFERALRKQGAGARWLRQIGLSIQALVRWIRHLTRF